MTKVSGAAGGGLWRRLRHEFVTPESIYGTIIVAALIVLIEDGDTDFDMIASVSITVFVFWIAHVFAATVATHGKRNGVEIPLGEALARAVRHAAGLPVSAILPIGMLALGASGLIDDDLAYVLALLTSVLILTGLGVLAFAERGAKWYSCVVGGLATGLLGLAVIMLKVVLH
ncbi:hypothetical protein ACEXQD_14960 [Herbiconiux sp. P15]|uniref:hypothetical protein n=1 Tax=Herbiconiux liukaitaii TaxID=3342799 RepID=UPI0035BA65B2